MDQEQKIVKKKIGRPKKIRFDMNLKITKINIIIYFD
jgi:hypothetical protein